MADRLELAALLHDVGRALDPRNSEPHGFVGARFLDACGLDDVAPLVAHHSGAQLEAAARGMTDLDRWITIEPDLLHVLTFLDRTTSASGERVSLAERRLDIAVRYGADSRQVEIFDAAGYHDCDQARSGCEERSSAGPSTRLMATFPS
jgi:predicted HD phosphohydrolase